MNRRITLIPNITNIFAFLFYFDFSFLRKKKVEQSFVRNIRNVEKKAISNQNSSDNRRVRAPSSGR